MTRSDRGPASVADVLGSVDFFGDGFYLGLDRHVEVVKKLELAGLIGRSDNKFGKLDGAFPPSAQWVDGAAPRAPDSIAIRLTASISSGWSVSNALIATTGVTPCSLMFSICFRRFGAGFDVPDIILEHLGRQCLSGHDAVLSAV